MALVERARSPCVQARACRRRRSAPAAVVTMPRMRWRVVCGRGVTMVSFCADQRIEQRRLADVRAADEGGEAAAESACCIAHGDLRTSRGNCVAARARPPPARRGAGSSPRPRARSLERRHLAGDRESLRVRLALDALHAYTRQRQAARLQVLLQAGLGILQRRRRRARLRCAARTALRVSALRPPRARRRETRAAQRLEGIGQDRLAAKAAGLELAGTQLQPRRAAMRAATSASGSPLTSRARRRLRSPSSPSGRRRTDARPRCRLSTASPRNSSRSLLAPAGAAVGQRGANSARSRGS